MEVFTVGLTEIYGKSKIGNTYKSAHPNIQTATRKLLIILEKYIKIFKYLYMCPIIYHIISMH